MRLNTWCRKLKNTEYSISSDLGPYSETQPPFFIAASFFPLSSGRPCDHKYSSRQSWTNFYFSSRGRPLHTHVNRYWHLSVSSTLSSLVPVHFSTAGNGLSIRLAAAPFFPRLHFLSLFFSHHSSTYIPRKSTSRSSSLSRFVSFFDGANNQRCTHTLHVLTCIKELINSVRFLSDRILIERSLSYSSHPI